MIAPLSRLDIANLFGLPAPERYTHFLAEVARSGRVWTLCGEGGFVAFCDEDGRDCFPFWPAPELAQALADADWSDCRPEPLDLDVFMDRWLKGMAKDGRQVSVFPAPDGTGIVMDPLALLQDIEEELGQPSD